MFGANRMRASLTAWMAAALIVFSIVSYSVSSISAAEPQAAQAPAPAVAAQCWAPSKRSPALRLLLRLIRAAR